MRLGRLLKAENSLAPVAAVSVATGKQGRPGNPYTVFVAAQLNLGKWDDHREETVAHDRGDVKQMLHARRLTHGQKRGPILRAVTGAATLPESRPFAVKNSSPSFVDPGAGPSAS